jgi:hypothetical protein
MLRRILVLASLPACAIAAVMATHAFGDVAQWQTSNSGAFATKSDTTVNMDIDLGGGTQSSVRCTDSSFSFTVNATPAPPPANVPTWTSVISSPTLTFSGCNYATNTYDVACGTGITISTLDGPGAFDTGTPGFTRVQINDITCSLSLGGNVCGTLSGDVQATWWNPSGGFAGNIQIDKDNQNLTMATVATTCILRYQVQSGPVRLKSDCRNVKYNYKTTQVTTGDPLPIADQPSLFWG